MVTGRHFAILALLLPRALTVQVQGANADSPAMTQQQLGEAVFLDALSIPCPGEVFVALNKACRPNWATLVTPATAPMTTDRSQLALVVGILAANGYIAVEAQDGQQVRNVGKEIMAVAKALGVSQSLMGRGNSLMEFAGNNAWELQGLEVIRQPDLARKLASQLGSLPPRIRDGALVVAVRQTLESAATLLATRGLSPEQERGNLQTIHEECSSVVKAILKSSTVASPSPEAVTSNTPAGTNAATPVKP